MRIGSDLIVQPAPCLFAPMSARMPPSASSAAGEGNLSLRGRRILIVEDESLIAMLIGDAVEEAGGEVVGPCYTVAECMKAAQVEEIDAAVLDVDLAGRTSSGSGRSPSCSTPRTPTARSSARSSAMFRCAVSRLR
jgi:hypothetical protein